MGSSVRLRLPLGPTQLTPDSINMVSMESFSLFEDQLKLEPRVFYNLTTGTVSSYGTFIILAISFAIAAIGGLLYYGLQNMSSRSYGYDTDSYNYQRFEEDYFSRRSQDYLDKTNILAQIAKVDENYNKNQK